MSNTNLTCPVCGTAKTSDSTICSKCGFEGAYYTFFSGEKAYNAWKLLVEARKNAFIGEAYHKKREQGSQLLVTGDRVCFFDAEKSKAVIVGFNNNEPQVLDNVKQISLSAHFHAWLNNSGTVGAFGDNVAGQCIVDKLIEIISIATASECTYAVRADGTVAIRGATDVREQVSSWTDIKSICCAEQHVIGLKNDSTVVYATKEGSLFGSYASVMKDWKNVKKVVTGDYYAMALCDDGTILYAGVNDQKAQCTSWKNIVDIAADGQYAVGLTENGDVLLAGDSLPIIDFGRKEAAKWTDMVLIATGRNLIAGLSKKGELKIVGNIIKSDEIDETFKNAVQANLE